MLKIQEMIRKKKSCLISYCLLSLIKKHWNSTVVANVINVLALKRCNHKVVLVKNERNKLYMSDIGIKYSCT